MQGYTDTIDVVVVGGGPAGCCVAIGLHRLGYEVRLVTTRRPWPSCEGISVRTLQGLRSAHLLRALEQVGGATPRRARWNDETADANTEHLVLRRDFDRALLEDVEAGGVPVLHGRMLQHETVANGGHRLDLKLEDAGPTRLDCRFFVDARGRGVPGREGTRLRGPETVSLVQVRGGPAGEAGSLVCSFRDGWTWLAQLADGTRFVQLTVDGRAAPKRAGAEDWIEHHLRAIPAARPWLEGTAGTSPVFARGSTSLLRQNLVGACSIRVGDAAMAVDPLSGNGIFQSLSSALVAPAVINTLLRFPEDAAPAQAFYRERVHHTFLRFARTGRDFYRLESGRAGNAFWQARQRWPDDEPAHPAGDPAFLGIRERPVVADQRIRIRPVALTSDQPLGVWHVDGAELAPLLRELPDAPEARAAALQDRVRAACAGDATRARRLTAWLRHYALL